MLKRLSILLFLSPLPLLAGSVDVRQETVEGMAVGTVNNNFRRLEKDKLDKRAVEKLISEAGATSVDGEDIAPASVTASTVTATAFLGTWSFVPQQIMSVYDQKSPGTDGGTCTSGSWNTRTLNQSSTNTITGSSVASNIITLPAGTYRAVWRAPAFRCDRHKTRFISTSGPAITFYGSSAFSSNVNNDPVTDSVGFAYFSIASVTTFVLTHRCETTAADQGFGVAAGFAEEEVYAQIEITRIR